MMNNNEKKEMVECFYKGTVVHIPVGVFLSMAMGVQVEKKKFVRYKEGALIYGMCEREFNKLAHEAKAVYKRNKMALVNLELIDQYLEGFRE